MDVDGLVRRVDELVAHAAGRVIIGIAGKPGAGKTTIALTLVRRLAGAEDWRGTRAAYVPMDGFHLADAELVRLGCRDRKGAPDTFDSGGYAALIARIASGESVWAPAFERTLEQPIAQSLPVTPSTKVVVTEGNYLLLPEAPWCDARRHFAQTWYVRMDEQTRYARLLARHIEFGKTPQQAREWIARSDQANAAPIERAAGSADLVIEVD